MLQSMESRPNLETVDDLESKFARTRPNNLFMNTFSKKDPDIPVSEDQEVKKKFPFVTSIQYGKPIDTRLRASIRTKQEFDSVDKL